MRMETHDGRSNAMQQHYFGIERQARERQEGLLREARLRRLAREASRAARAEATTSEEGVRMMGQRAIGANKVSGRALVGRMSSVLVTVLAGVLMAGGMAVAATTTFVSSSPIQIPVLGAASPYPSQLNVQGISGTIKDLNVDLRGFSHTFPDDVDVILQHGDRSAVVMSDAGGYIDANEIFFTLDDEAADHLPQNDEVALTGGSFRPTDQDIGLEDTALPPPADGLPTDGSALSVFDGMDPNGVWFLYVVDDSDADSGQLSNGWALEITTGSPDTTAPRVESTSPQPAATGVSPTANVAATFSEDMKPSSVNGTVFELFKKGVTTKLAASVRYDEGTDRAILDPANSLKRGATYRAVVTTDARDLAGNRLDQNPSLSGLQQKRWSFTVRN